jgi:tetratricopeptide (TPR) repeat protein
MTKTAFISYSQDSTEHSERVLSLAFALRSNGIDVDLDQFHNETIVDWPRWCRQQMHRDRADFVLCVCTAEYRRRIDHGERPEIGKGVYWEGSLLDDEIYDAKGNRRIVPILFEGEPATSIPDFLRGWTYCRLKDFTLSDRGYEHLVRILSGQARVQKNELGPVPTLPTRRAPAEREPLIHTLSLDQEIEGRTIECDEILREMTGPRSHVLAFAAPGGFGKTALLTKLIQKLSGSDRSVLDTVTLSNREVINPRVGALLHIDGREGVRLPELFENAGRLIGQRQAFKDLYADTNRNLSQKAVEMCRRLSVDPEERTWFVFDNFEPLLDDKGAISDRELREVFGAIFAGGHNVYALIAGRDVPVFSPRERVVELRTVGDSLYQGLPLEDCVVYLKKNGAAAGLSGDAQKVDSVLTAFAERVHRVPLALVWAVGYLEETNFTLQELLDRTDLFADFDRGQGQKAEDYRNKGLKRLHYEQLQHQPEERVPLLALLAFFKRPVSKGALAHLLDEPTLNKTLTRLERNKLVSHTESADGYARSLNDPFEINLYGLHPVICENEFFTTLSGKEQLFETAADECRTRALGTYYRTRFSYALELFTCAEVLYEHLVQVLKRTGLLNYYAAMLANKGVALWKLQRLTEALAEFDKAIAIWERLDYSEQQTHLANELPMAYTNKGNALRDLQRATEALAEYDKAIAILERLDLSEQQTRIANAVATAYMNKGAVFQTLHQLTEALAEYDKAIEIRERLVDHEQQTHLANDLAMAYMNKGTALDSLQQVKEALVQYDKAIAIRERLVYREQQTHLANNLGTAYMNKALLLEEQNEVEQALNSYEAAVQLRRFCLEQLGMFWIVPELLKTLRYRLMTLVDLQRWPVAAQHLLEVWRIGSPFLESSAITEELKRIALIEMAETLRLVQGLDAAQSDLLYAELGDDAETVRSLVDSMPA